MAVFHRDDILTKELCKYHLPKLCSSKSAHATRSCLRQLQVDVKYVFGEKEDESWIMNSTKNSVLYKREIMCVWILSAMDSFK